jgi:hypothetical protein
MQTIASTLLLQLQYDKWCHKTADPSVLGGGSLTGGDRLGVTQKEEGGVEDINTNKPEE